MTAASLALICLLSLTGPLVSLIPKVHLPVGIIQLFLGVLVGSSVLNLVDSHDPIFRFLADDVGFALVMFVAGSHVPLASSRLKTGLGTGTGRAVIIAVLSVPAGFLLAYVLGLSNPLMYAVIIASSSAAVILPTLAGTPTTGAPMISLLVQIAVADVLATIFLPLVVDPAQASQRLLGVLLVLTTSCLIYLILKKLEKRGRLKRFKKISRRSNLALELRVSLILLFSLVALGQIGGVSPMLGGFCLGLVLASLRKTKRLSKQLFVITDGFFGPLFFIWLGASLNIRGVFAEPRLLLLSVGIVLLSLLVHGLMVFTGQSLPLALISTAQLGIPAAAASLGITSGVLAPGEDAALLLGALLTIGVAVVLTPAVQKIAEKTAQS